ncbi:hypothetical protein [Serratia nevei]|uniref:hypothetical protein n=1 Tax=Serratia nevei TaxID=2703794 RepID=UPI003FA7EC9A
MKEIKTYDYLVIGGEHDGQVFNGPLASYLEVTCEKQSLPRFYAKDEPAELTVVKTVKYKVIDHTSAYDVSFFVASNEDLTGIDVDALIGASGISPVR